MPLRKCDIIKCFFMTIQLSIQQNLVSLPKKNLQWRIGSPYKYDTILMMSLCVLASGKVIPTS